MKHIKLFEEYTKFPNQKESSVYMKTQDLPFFGYCEVDDEQSVAIQLELLDKGYRNFPADFSSFQKYSHEVLDPKGKNLIVWNGRRKEISLEVLPVYDIKRYDVVNAKVYYGYDGMATPPPFELVKFDDYFKPKPGYEGHFHGKQYGI
jgi:hypothetical protein